MPSKIEPKQTFYTPGGPPETAFTRKSVDRTIKQYDSLIADLIRDKNIYRVGFFASLAFLALSVYGWYQTKNLPRTAPVVIEVNEFGTPTYLGTIDKISYETYQPKDYVIVSHITRFLSYIREISLDSEMMYKNITEEAFEWVSRDIRKRLTADINADGPFQKVGTIKRSVAIESVLRSTKNTWQADWFDVETTIAGQEIRRVKYRGLFTIAQQEPETERQKIKNPLGIYIVDYSITELKTGGQ